MARGMAGELAGQVALVTGGRMGIGRAIALALAGAGARVAVTSRRGTDLGPVEEAMAAAGQPGLALALDLRAGEDAMERVVEAVVARWGRLDILVNNAAVSYPAAAMDLTAEQWDETFAVNVRGAFLLSRAAARRMREQGDGRIINISSTFAFTVRLERSAYGASKAALGNLTKALAVEWAPYGIRVNAVAPCATRTPSREAVFAQPGVEAALTARIPLGRLAEPEDVAAAVLFLAQAGSAFVTGHTLMVDGGWSAW